MGRGAAVWFDDVRGGKMLDGISWVGRGGSSSTNVDWCLRSVFALRVIVADYGGTLGKGSIHNRGGRRMV